MTDQPYTPEEQALREEIQARFIAFDDHVGEINPDCTCKGPKQCASCLDLEDHWIEQQIAADPRLQVMQAKWNTYVDALIVEQEGVPMPEAWERRKHRIVQEMLAEQAGR